MTGSGRTADLHSHTDESDGTVSLAERLRIAGERGLDAVAVTDHDAINPDLTGRRMVDEETGVEVITGAEIKCAVGYEGKEIGIEILSYFIDPDSEAINSVLEENSRRRVQRMEEMVENVNREINYELELDEVLEYAGGNVGRPHLADALADIEAIQEVDEPEEAFEEYLGEDCDAYVPTPKQDAETVIEAVLEDGGVPVLAHPGRDLEEDEVDEVVETLAEYGLKGLEVEYSWSHKIENGFGISFAEEKCRELADEYDLIETGGSDCHGPGSGKDLMGSVEIPYRQVEKLAEEAEAEVAL